MRLLHITDPHLTSLEGQRLWPLKGKRWSGYLSWRQKRQFIHRRDVLEHLTEAVRGEDPALILVTGDLVHIGLKEEIEAAAEWLESLGPPERVMLVPGNHDVYGRDSWSAVAACWGPYLAPDAGGAEAVFPVIRRVGTVEAPLCLLGLSSARPSPLFMAYGRLGTLQLARLDSSLGEAHGFRCVLLHHPPLPGMSSWRKGLRDARGLASVLAERGAELLLHGHVHRNVAVVGPGGVRVFGTASASSVSLGASAAYRTFDVVRCADTWRVDMRLVTVDADGGRAETEALRWETAVSRSANAASGGR